MSGVTLAEAVQGAAPGAAPAPATLARVELDPAALQRDMGRLVLTLVEFLRRLLEAQAVRRMEAGTITDAQVEALGDTLERARDAVLDMCARLDVAPDSLNLDLGPLGRLM